jgi:hypothetical protein
MSVYFIFNKGNIGKKYNWCFEDNKCTQKPGCPEGNIRSDEADCKGQIVN